MPLKIDGKTVSTTYETLLEEAQVLHVSASEVWTSLRINLREKGIINQAQLVRARALFNTKVKSVTESNFASLEALAVSLYGDLSLLGLLPVDSCTFQVETIAEAIKSKSDIQLFNDKGAHKTVSRILMHNGMLLSEVSGDLNIQQTAKQLADIPMLNAAGLQTLEASALFPTPWGTEAFISKEIEGLIPTRIVEGVSLVKAGVSAISNGKFYEALVKSKIFSNGIKLGVTIGDLEKLYDFTGEEKNLTFFSDLQCLLKISTGHLIFHDPSECKLIESRVIETYRKKRLLLKKLIDVLKERATKL